MAAPNLHVSDEAKKALGGDGFEYFGSQLMTRSYQRWLQGVRTHRHDLEPRGLWPFDFPPAKLESGQFLVSTYLGGEIAVITTASDQWLLMTDELPQAAQVYKERQRDATPFVFKTVIRPKGEEPA
jgi:hypothetical protein